MGKMKRFFVVILAMLLLLAACSSSNGDTPANNADSANNGGDAAPDVQSEKVVKLPAFTIQSGAIQNYDDNDLTKLIEDKFSVDIQWTLGPPEAGLEKQNVLLASGNYPAVFFAGEFSQVDQIKYGRSGILIPLNDLIEKYGPNIKKAFEQSPYLLKAATAPDGNIYSLPVVEECGHCEYAQKYWINTEWLKALGLEMPKTTDEFYEVLKAFKDKDPNGNGKPDEIPLTGTPDWWHGNVIYFLMNAFTYASDMTFLSLHDGTVDISANKTEWKEGLAYLNKLYKEGLLDPQAFTQKTDGFDGVVNNPDTVIVGSFASGCCFPTVTDDGRHTQYAAIPPLKGPQGTQLTAYFGGQVGNGLFAITNNATEEQQIKAMQIVDYLFSEEGSINEMYGPKGTYWEDAAPDDVGIDGKPAIFKVIGNQFNAEEGGNKQNTWDNNLKYTPAYLFNGIAQGQDLTKANAYERVLSNNTEPYKPFKPKETFPLAIWLNPDQATELAQLQTDIQTYIDTNAAQFITGQKNLDTDWDAYVQGFNGLGLDRFLKANQEAYDEQYK
jgi:putative aldouronate transport system substrate-binding protein